MAELDTDVLVVGGGLGGVAGALAAARSGRRVILTEQYPWLGGQLTSQAVPPDEHRWVEQFGTTRSYRDLRDGIRRYYRRHYPLTERARHWSELNPGAGAVSRLCHEPRVAVAVIDAMLAPYRSSGRLQVLQPAMPVAATTDGDQVTSVTIRASGHRRADGGHSRLRAGRHRDRRPPPADRLRVRHGLRIPRRDRRTACAGRVAAAEHAGRLGLLRGGPRRRRPHDRQAVGLRLLAQLPARLLGRAAVLLGRTQSAYRGPRAADLRPESGRRSVGRPGRPQQGGR